MEHFLDGSRGAFENAEGDHLVKPEVGVDLRFVLKGSLGVNYMLLTIQVLPKWVPLVVRECATQIHYLLLARVLQHLVEPILLRQGVQGG